VTFSTPAPDYNNYQNRDNLWVVQKATKLRLLELLAPFFLGLGSFVKVVYIGVFGWWLDPLLQRRANRELIRDIKTNLPSLVSEAGSITIVRSDWPEVKIHYGNLLFTIVRFRGDIAVSVAPCHAPKDSYELGPVIAAIECRHFSERDIVNDLVDAEHLLRPRLHQLNAAFSEQEYPRIRERL
jgi:hypothetical protein